MPTAPKFCPSVPIALTVPVPLYEGATTVDAGVSDNTALCTTPDISISKYVLPNSLGCSF